MTVATRAVASHRIVKSPGGWTVSAAATDAASIGWSNSRVSGVAGSCAVPIGTNRSADTGAGTEAGTATPAEGGRAIETRSASTGAPAIMPRTPAAAPRRRTDPMNAPRSTGAAIIAAPGFRNTTSSKRAGARAKGAGRQRVGVDRGLAPGCQVGTDDTTRPGGGTRATQLGRLPRHATRAALGPSPVKRAPRLATRGFRVPAAASGPAGR